MGNNTNRNKIPSISYSLRSFLTSTGFLTNGLLVLGAIVLLGGVAISGRVDQPYLRERYDMIVMIISLPWFMASCVFIVLRKEIPRLGLPSIKGGWAVIQGVIGLLVLLCAEIYAIYLLVSAFNS